MADRVGIPEARDTRGRLHPRAANDMSPRPYAAYKPLQCGGCTIGVVGKQSYQRRTPGGGTTSVMAHYALATQGEHDPDCRYDFDKRAERIIEDSRGTVVRAKGIYELLLPSSGKAEPAKRLPSAGSGRPRTRLRVSHSNRTLPAALGSAMAILRLLREFDDDPDAVGRFAARWGSEKITWSQFCRTMTDLSSVASLLRELGTIGHPLALHGTVSAIGTAGGGSTYELRNADPQGRIDYRGRKRRTRVVVRSKNPDAFTQVQPGDEWLGFGHWKLWAPDDGAEAYVNLWIDGPWSLATWRN